MTDRFRYLPCALHPALAHPFWAKVLVMPGGPNGLTAPFVKLWADHQPFVDLTYSSGWGHAVRAYVAICGGTVGESRDVRFDVFCADDGWEPDGYNGETIPGRRIPEVPMSQWYEPAGRREALCRCICAALRVDVDQVFPKDKE